jgi:hypothetical protein
LSSRALGQGSNNGLIVLPGSLTLLHRKLIITLAANHHVPAVYPYRYHVTMAASFPMGLTRRSNPQGREAG